MSRGKSDEHPWLRTTVICGVVVAVATAALALFAWRADQEGQADRAAAAASASESRAHQVEAEAKAEAKAAQIKLAQDFDADVAALSGADMTAHVNAVQALVEFARTNTQFGVRAVMALAHPLKQSAPRTAHESYAKVVPYEAQWAAGELRELLKSLYPDPGQAIPKLDLSNLDLHGQSWGSMRMAGAYAEWLDLRGANLSLARMAGADLRYSSMACANLTDADLHSARLDGVDLRGANLAGANLSVKGTLDPSQYVGAHWDADTKWPDGSPPVWVSSSPWHHGSCTAALGDLADPPASGTRTPQDLPSQDGTSVPDPTSSPSAT